MRITRLAVFYAIDSPLLFKINKKKCGLSLRILKIAMVFILFDFSNDALVQSPLEYCDKLLGQECLDCDIQYSGAPTCPNAGEALTMLGASASRAGFLPKHFARSERKMERARSSSAAAPKGGFHSIFHLMGLSAGAFSSGQNRCSSDRDAGGSDLAPSDALEKHVRARRPIAVVMPWMTGGLALRGLRSGHCSDLFRFGFLSKAPD